MIFVQYFKFEILFYIANKLIIILFIGDNNNSQDNQHSPSKRVKFSNDEWDSLDEAHLQGGSLWKEICEVMDVAGGEASAEEEQNDWLDIAHQNRSDTWLEICKATEAPPPVNVDPATIPTTEEAHSVQQPENEPGATEAPQIDVDSATAPITVEVN